MEITYVGAITGIFLIIFAATLFAFFEGTTQFALAIEVMKLFAMLTVILATARVVWLLGIRSGRGKVWAAVLIGFIMFLAGEGLGSYIGDGFASEILASLGSAVLVVALFFALRQFQFMAPPKTIYVSLAILFVFAVVMAYLLLPVLQSDKLTPFEKVRLFGAPLFELAGIVLVIDIAIAFVGSGLEKAWVFLIQGVLSILSADLIIAYLKVSPAGYTAGVADLLYIIGWMLLAIGIFLYRAAPMEFRKLTMPKLG